VGYELIKDVTSERDIWTQKMWWRWREE